MGKTAAVSSLLAVLACQAHAEGEVQEMMSRWTVRAGAVAVRFDPNSSVELPVGSSVPGASVGVKNNTGVGAEMVYDLAPNWRGHFAFGTPPVTSMRAEGSLAAYVRPNGPLTGVLGKARYAPLMLTASYKLGNFGGVVPYVGAGINYTWVMKATDGDLSDFSVKSAWGPVIQAGVDIPIDKRWGIFLDARKVFVKTTGTGRIAALGSLPGRTDVKLNPLIVVAGVSYRF